MEFIVLNNGVRCPVIYIGTFMLSPEDADPGCPTIQV